MHSKNIREVIAELNGNITSGLTDDEVKKRNNIKNEISKKKKTPLVLRFLMQFKDTLILILLGAAILSIIVNPNEWLDSLVILIVVLINAFLGVAQETKAEKTLESISKLSSPKARVIRNGREYVIDSKDVVLGDLILFSAGDLIPADARIIDSNELKVDESALTGESVTVEKRKGEVNKETPLAERTNMVYATSVVTNGFGKAIVCEIGMTTEVGKIAQLLVNNENELTPLQIQLNKLGKLLGFICLIICFFIFVLELVAGLDVLSSFNTAITLAVAAIPEGLATVVTIVLALGVQRLVKENVLIRKLPSVETLGCASYVCSDKTGTLTQNKMTVKKIYYYADDQILSCDYNLNEKQKTILAYSALCSDCKKVLKENKYEYIGDPTEIALVNANNKYGFENATNEYEVVHQYPFDSNRKMMSVIIRYQNDYVVITKGAPDFLLKVCKNVDVKKVNDVNNKMASGAMRVIAIAIKRIDNFSNIENLKSIENNLSFIGLIGMIDPPREEVKESIVVAKKAGVKTVMITGDHLTTACAIGKDLGILENEKEAMLGSELDKLSVDQLKTKVKDISVFARTTPAHKVKIIEALKSNGEVVAMTGDGVNDAPSLRKADIGCAMGKGGTEVAKNASSLVLLDDNYTSIIKAIKEGRGIYNNIQKVVHFLLSSNIGEVFVIALASIISIITPFKVPVPLQPIHLLFVNLITDSFPAFALGLDKVDNTVMENPPRKKDESIFNKGKWGKIIYQGIFIGLISLISFIVGNNESYEIGMTMSFVTLSFSQLFHAFNVRNDKSILNKSFFTNKYLLYSLLFGGIFSILVINIPFLYSIFQLHPLGILEFLVSVGLAFMIVVLEETIKEVKRMIKS